MLRILAFAFGDQQNGSGSATGAPTDGGFLIRDFGKRKPKAQDLTPQSPHRSKKRPRADGQAGAVPYSTAQQQERKR
jgi:hypothetical protein